MQERWLSKGPALDEVVSGRTDRRRGSKGTAIVITTYRNGRMLAEHLKALEDQTDQGFDVIIVYGQGDQIVENRRLSVLHVFEKARSGCSGGYYIGEKTALSEGYEIVVLADDDCFPQSKDLIEKLVSGIRGGSKVVLPMLEKNGKRVMTSMPHYYGAMSRDVLEKSGLTYFPLFFGGDDAELMRRINKAGYAHVHADVTVSHPDMVPFLVDPSPRRYYYTRGEFEALVLGRGLFQPAVFASMHVLAACSLAGLGRTDIAGRMLSGLIDGASMEFFQNKSVAPGAAPDEDCKGGWDEVSAPAGGGKFISVSMLLHRGSSEGRSLSALASRTVESLGRIPRYFGKKVLFKSANGQQNLIAMLGSRSAFVEFNGRVGKVFENRGTARILLGLLFVLLAIPPSLFLGVALSLAAHLNRMVRRADSRAYGL